MFEISDITYDSIKRKTNVRVEQNSDKLIVTIEYGLHSGRIYLDTSVNNDTTTTTTTTTTAPPSVPTPTPPPAPTPTTTR